MVVQLFANFGIHGGQTMLVRHLCSEYPESLNLTAVIYKLVLRVGVGVLAWSVTKHGKPVVSSRGRSYVLSQW